MTYKLALASWTNLGDRLERKGVKYLFLEGRNDGFIYQIGDPDGQSKFHIHSIERVNNDDMVFDKLLVKSGNWREGDEPDLATLDINQWLIACTGMNSSTIFSVNALADCFRELGAIKQ